MLLLYGLAEIITHIISLKSRDTLKGREKTIFFNETPTVVLTKTQFDGGNHTRLKI